MKKIFIYLTGLLCLATVSCKKSFEDQPLTNVTEDYIWDASDVTGTYASVFVNKIYSQLPTGWIRVNGVSLECASDDAVPSNGTNATWNVINGGYNPLATFDDNWGSSYSAIRNANLFLSNYRRVPWQDPTIPQWLAAETRAMRAYFYYDLLKRYGGVPLMYNNVYGWNDAALFQLKRNSFDSCISYVVSELDAIKDSLRPDASLAVRGQGNGAEGLDADAGRIRKSIVLAIKAKVLLLAASPLFNPSLTTDKPYTGYSGYDKERWGTAA